jgi:hypothetical protein
VEACWQLPGYDIGARIRVDALGDLWRAQRSDDGSTVLLRRLLTAGTAARDRLRRDAAVLGSTLVAAGLAKHVVAVIDVVSSDDDVVLVLDDAPGGSLAKVLSVRGGLSPHEVVTLLAPLCRALDAAHGAGLPHGNVVPANVWFDAGGRPMLADFGVAAALGHSRPAAADDVRALAALGVLALAEQWVEAPSALRSALEAARDAGSGDHVSAGELAGLVLDSCAAAPIGLVRAAAVPPPRDRAAPRRRALAGVVAVALLGGALAGGVGWGRSANRPATSLAPVPSPASSGVPSAAVQSTDPSPTTPIGPVWREVVRHLERLRARAFTTGDRALLRQVYAPATPLAARELSRLTELRRIGLRPRGLVPTVEGVSVRSAVADRVVLRVVDSLSPYGLVAVGGQVVSRARARPAHAVMMTVVRIGGRWRIADVRAP